jgi:mono/diheme cytochrome c family protein
VSQRDPETPAPLSGEARNIDQANLLLIVLAILIISVVVGFVVVLPSWRPKSDMSQQPYYKPYRPSDLFADGMSERPLISGVVPRPAARSPGIPYIAVRTPGPANFPDIAATNRIPVPITRRLLERGQERYNIYCAVCHGAVGGGDGMIVHRGFYPPPSYFIPRLRSAADSHFYNVISNGYGTMFSYSDRVAPEDRWAIVAYIRALQLAVEQHPALNSSMQKPAGVQP